jgi:cobalt/nickel transport system permease protein
MAMQISLKAATILLVLTTLVATSPVADLGHALHTLKVPGPLVLLLLLTYRYTFVIHQEYQRLWLAARVRGFRPGTNLHSYRTYAYLVGMLFVRAAARADRVHQAMRCRGFNGRFHSLRAFRSRPANWAFSTTMGVCLATLVYMEWLR